MKPVCQSVEKEAIGSAVSMFIFIGCGAWLVVLGLYFMVLRAPLLPEDLRYMGTNLGVIQSAVPGLERWLHRVFTVMGGFIAGAGVLTIFLAARPVMHKRWTLGALALAGLLTVGTMTVTNFQLNSDFKLLLLFPSLLWLIALVCGIVYDER